MNTQTDQQLLQDYAASRSESAFAELVRRQVDLVYSAALRRVGDPHLAQDITQGTFAALAQNARSLTSHPVLSGWLHRTTQNIATNLIRTNTRRQAREQEVVTMNQLLSSPADANWQDIAPHLDAALDELDNADRDAVMLRYFERKSAHEMAAQLGISNDAAQKRVGRAVERLREFFAKRGVTVGTSGLTVVISANAVQAAPVGMALTISTAAALTATATVTTIATQTTMNWLTTKALTAIVATSIAVGTGTYVVQQRNANDLRNRNTNLTTEKESLRKELDGVLTSMASVKAETERLQENQKDLLRLRSEIGSLRKQLTELGQLRTENQKLRSARAATEAASKEDSETPSDPEQQMKMAKLNDAKLLVLGMMMFARDNRELLPTDLNQTTNYWKAVDYHRFTRTNEFELVLQGSFRNVTNVSEVIAVREKTPSWIQGRWVKAYGFADGHSQLLAEPPEGFEAWEKQRIIPSN